MLHSNTLANNPITISNTDKTYIIANHVDIFRDKSKSFTIDKIILAHSDAFISSEKKDLNFGFTNDAIWLRFSVINTNPTITQWMMMISYYFLWEIDFYIIQGDQIIDHKKSGILTPSKTYDLPNRLYVFDLLLQAENAYTFYMRFASDMPISLPISIISLNKLTKRSLSQNFLKGGFYGILLLIIIYHIYLFGTQKEKIHFYFLGFILTFFLIRFTFDGFTRKVIFSDYHQANILFSTFFPILIPILFFCGILFVLSFTQPTKMPRIFNSIFLVLKLIWFSFGGFFLLGFSRVIPLFPVCAVFTMIVIIFFFVFLWKLGYSPAYYYILGWVFFATGFVVYSLLRLNYIPGNVFFEVSMEIGFLVMILCFQFSFIYQANLIKKQKQSYHLQLIEKAEENAMLIQMQKIRLEEEVAQRTKELYDAKNKAEQANLTKSKFFASINHDLRTPLNSIMGYSQIFQYANKSPQAFQEGFQAVHESGKYLLSLINDLLDMSKIESSSFELLPDIFDLNDFIARIQKTIQVLAEQKNLIFTTSVDPNLPDAIITDEKRLYQVLFNLLGNAVKFTDKGEVSFSIKKTKDKGHLNENTVSIYFEIKDTGPGIKKEHLPDIFVPYRQVSSTKIMEGSGLGLSISQSIVQLMGGTISVDSIPGKGSTFWFQLSLPSAKKIKSRSTEIRHIPQIVSDPPKKILIVDDILHNRVVLKEFLTIVGCDSLLAENGHECIQKAIESKPDLILLDIQMPIMDGIETLHLMRAMNDISHIPVVAVSASVNGMTIQSILQKGFNDFIPKPVELYKLVQTIQKHLDVDVRYNKQNNCLQQKNVLSDISKPGQASSDNEKIDQLPIIDIKEAKARLRNDDSLFKQILEMAVEDIPLYIATLEENLFDRQPGKVQQNLHKLKSSFKLIAAKRCLASIELISQKIDSFNDDPADFHSLKKEWQHLFHQIKLITKGKKAE